MYSVHIIITCIICVYLYYNTSIILLRRRRHCCCMGTSVLLYNKKYVQLSRDIRKLGLEFLPISIYTEQNVSGRIGVITHINKFQK